MNTVPTDIVNIMMMVGTMLGMVMWMSRCHLPAPSSAAASCKSGLMFEIAATYTMEPYPAPCQTPASVLIHQKYLGLVSISSRFAPSATKRSVMTPVSLMKSLMSEHTTTVATK